MRRISSIFLVIIILFLARTGAASDELEFFGVSRDMLDAQYWISRTRQADKILLTPQEISELSTKLKHTNGTYCTDILSLPDLMPRARALSEIKNFSVAPKTKRFTLDGEEIDEAFRCDVHKNANIDAICETIILRFAAVCENSVLRILPYDGPLYEDTDSTEFDLNVVSSLKIWEPLAILHESRDGKFYFAIASNCSGWIKKENAAICDKKLLRELVARPFLVVTGSRVTGEIRAPEQNAKRREFFMGTRLPLADEIKDNYTVGSSLTFGRASLVPERVKDGTLSVAVERIPLSADVVEGYLPYTRRNIILQAFKMLGERYGWGGTFGARDCSALVQDIYLTFGIELPRNSSVQATAPIGHIDISKLSDREKENLLARFGAGALVRMPGHIMIYIGRSKKRPFIIHAAYSLSSRIDAANREICAVNCVVVSDMEITRKDGTRIIDAITDINVIK